MKVLADRPETPSAILTDLRAIFVSMELSRSSWLLISVSPGGGEKMSKHAVAAGNIAGLLKWLAQLKEKAHARTGRDTQIITIQEAGLDGFWIHRVLQSGHIESHVVDPASILTSRRRRRAKTDKIDGETLVRTLLAHKRGEPRVCAMVKVPTPEKEDRHRLCRERKTLVAERVEHVNRIKGLLFAQGIYDYEPLKLNRRAQLEELQTGDRRPLPAHLKAQICRELDRLEMILTQLKTIEEERDALLGPVSDKALTTPASMLLQLKGIGTEFAAVLWCEGLFRHFDNRRQLAAYAGLAPTPWQSGSLAHEQGVSKAGNPRAANHDGPARLAMAAPPAGLGAKPLVPRPGQAQWRAPEEDNHRCARAQAAHRPLEICIPWRHHRRCSHEGLSAKEPTISQIPRT